MAKQTALLVLYFLSACLAAENPMIGKWACKSDDGNGNEIGWMLVIKEEGGKLSGSLVGDSGPIPLIEPRLDGNVFTFKFYINDNCTVQTKLKVEGKKFDGTFACPEVSGTMQGTKQP